MKKNFKEKDYYEILKFCDNAATIIGCAFLLCIGVYAYKASYSNKEKLHLKEIAVEEKKATDKSEHIIFRDTIADKAKQKVR